MSPDVSDDAAVPIRKRPDEEALFVHELNVLQDPLAKVLDLGSGQGTFDYTATAARIVAVDNQNQAGSRDIFKGRFAQADAGALPFASNQFDLAVANFVFEHFLNPAEVLREIQRILKPEGCLYVAIPSSASLDDRLFRLLGGARYHRQRFSFHSFVRSVYEATAMKLVAFSDWPAGFTWLNRQPSGSLLRRAVFRFLRWARDYLINRSKGASGYILLFKKGNSPGYRLVNHVCSSCGGGATLELTDRIERKCAQCGKKNPVRKDLRV